MADKRWYEINVSPFRTNVLDLVDRDDLVTQDGRKVEVRREYRDFVVIVDGKERVRTDDNLAASYCLNQVTVGGTKRW
jgi:hypothetical protein